MSRVLNILHVDDDQAEHFLLKHMLKNEEEIELTFTISVNNALELLETSSFDCIVCDYQMPGRDGLELLNEVSARKIDVPFIFLTGQGSEKLAVDALRAGAHDYYTKDAGFAHYDRLVNSIIRAVEAKLLREERERMEEELRLKSLVLDQIGDRVTITDLNGVITYVNQAEVLALKMSRESLLGQNTQKYGEDPARGATQQEILETTLEKGSWRGEVINYASDGSEIFMECRTQMIRKADGTPVALSGIAIDISERRRMEEERRRSENYLKRVLQTTVDGFWIIDTKGIIRRVNSALCNMLGYTEAELLGKRLNEFDIDEILEVTAERINRIIKNGFEIFTTRHKCKDGSIIPLEVSSTYLDEQGGQFVCFLRDLTRRKKAENALRESERKWHNILVNTPQIGIALDTKGRVIFANTQFLELTGWKEDEVIGGDWFNIFIPESIRETVRGVFHTVLNSRDTLGYSTFENEIVTRSGELIDISWANVLTKDANGDIIDVTCLGVDITERKRKEEELRESEERFRAISQYSYNGICLVDEQTRIIWVNDRLLEMSGYTREQLLEAESFTAFIAPESQEFIMSNFKLFLAGENYQHHYRFAIIRADGQKRIFEKYMSHYFDRLGGKNLFIGMLDVTDQIMAEEELLQREERYKALDNAYFGGIAILDKGLILECSQGLSNITGYSYTEIIGMDGLQLFAEDSRDMVKSNILAGIEKPYEAMGLRKSGEIYPLRLEAKSIPFKGKLVSAIEFRDISEAKKPKNSRQNRS